MLNKYQELFQSNKGEEILVIFCPNYKQLQLICKGKVRLNIYYS